jgi:predicted kinase
MRLVRLYPEMIESRVCDGRIVEGHGDLRPEHIYLTPTPVVIDCVEFRRDFREIDVLDELCFLAMECERLGAAYIGKQILDYYCRVSADHPPAALAMLYRAYRACVRAKVHVLRARQLSGVQRSAAQGDARDYLQLADRYAARLGPPVMLLVRGRSGTGKSTLAAALAEGLALEYLTTDVLRQELFGTGQAAAFQQGSYTPENRQRVYDVLAQRATELLSSGVSVVVDGTFLTRASRRPLLEAAQQHRAVSLILECTCPLPVAQQRIAARRARCRPSAKNWISPRGLAAPSTRKPNLPR